MDPTTAQQYMESLVSTVAGRCPISVGNLTIGLHPDGERRETGELGIIDWSSPGGEVLACEAPEATFVALTGPFLAMGAALLAFDKHRPRDLLYLEDLVELASTISCSVDGGPEDPPLRMACAAQAAATNLLGRRGSCLIQHNLAGDERKLSQDASRTEAILPIHPWDFDTLTAVAYCPRSV